MNRKIGLFRKSKNVSFTENLPKRSQKRHSSANQTLFIYTSLSLLPIQKKTFSALHLPLAPSHNLLSTKERRCSCYLRSYSLRCNTRTSHRFKAFSPPSCAKNRFRLVPSENSAKSFFDRALNRGRRTESRVLFGYFLHNAKSDNPFPCRELRGSANLESAHPNNNHALTKLNPFAALRRLHFPTFCKVQKVGQKNFSACGGVMLLTQHSCRFAAKLKALPCGTARFRQAPMRAYRTHECFCPRRLYNNRCLYRHCSRTNRW